VPISIFSTCAVKNRASFICQFALYRRTILQIVPNGPPGRSASRKKCGLLSASVKDVGFSSEKILIFTGCFKNRGGGVFSDSFIFYHSQYGV